MRESQPPEPTSAARADVNWATLIPAIAVPVVVVLFLIFAFAWTRFVAKRKRDQNKVKPVKVILACIFCLSALIHVKVCCLRVSLTFRCVVYIHVYELFNNISIYLRLSLIFLY